MKKIMKRIVILCFSIIISCSPNENDATDTYNSIKILRYSVFEQYRDQNYFSPENIQ